MTDIEIVYREEYCAAWGGQYNPEHFQYQCYTQCAGDVGCPLYNSGEKKIPFGNCVYAQFKYKRKGWTGKRYEMQELKDQYAPQRDCMEVRLGNSYYDCEKVILNGKCIYNIYDDDDVQAKEKT